MKIQNEAGAGLDTAFSKQANFKKHSFSNGINLDKIKSQNDMLKQDNMLLDDQFEFDDGDNHSLLLVPTGGGLTPLGNSMNSANNISQASAFQG